MKQELYVCDSKHDKFCITYCNHSRPHTHGSCSNKCENENCFGKQVKCVIKLREESE